MGCGNSSATNTSGGGPAEVSKDVSLEKWLNTIPTLRFSSLPYSRPDKQARTEDPSADDEKRRNYGGVYVGLPADLTTVAASQSKSTCKD